MNIYDYFIFCESKMPSMRTPLRRTSFALRRAGVSTMEMLCEIKRERPKKLADLRDIGPQSLVVVDKVVRLFELTETTH